MLPYSFVKSAMKNRDYNICYFHMNDLTKEKQTLMTKAEYEEYFREPGSLKNRLVRYAKSNIGKGDVLKKLERLLRENIFISIDEAQNLFDWNNATIIEL